MFASPILTHWALNSDRIFTNSQQMILCIPRPSWRKKKKKKMGKVILLATWSLESKKCNYINGWLATQCPLFSDAPSVKIKGNPFKKAWQCPGRTLPGKLRCEPRIVRNRAVGHSVRVLKENPSHLCFRQEHMNVSYPLISSITQQHAFKIYFLVCML